MDKFDMYLGFFILPIIFFLSYLYTKRLISSLNNTDKNPPVPSPPRLPILGHLHHLSYLPHRSLWDLSKKYGPLMLLQLGPMPMLVVSSADVAKEVLKTHDVSFADRPDLSTIKRFFYNPKDVIVSPYGEQWRKLKSILVHRLLHNRKIKSFNSIMEEETSLLLEKISKLNSSSSGAALINLTTMFMSLTNDIISRSAFGKKLSPKQGKKLLDAIKEGLGLAISYNLGEFVPWLSWINRLNGFDDAVERVLKTRDEILDGVIRENLDDEERGGESLIDTLLDIHMDGNHENGESSTIDIESVKALLLNVVVAGTDTTAIVLEWAMTELIRNPIVMSKVEAEVQEIMGDKDMMITENELEKMHYLRAVIKETLRYHPPLTISYRMSREEVVDMMGYNIPAKTGVIINVWAIGRDPAYWDHDPEKFWPDRFMNMNNSCSTTPDFKGFDFHFTPFGAGRRICPGISFAVGVAELVLANLVHRFNWALPNGAKGEDLDVNEKPGPTNGRKNPLILIATNKP